MRIAFPSSFPFTRERWESCLVNPIPLRSVYA
jgi:hypothetical protein